MATGWEQDTGVVSRFDCGGSPASPFAPNCWVGSSFDTQVTPLNTFPTLALGTGTISIEFWIKMVLFTLYSSDVRAFIGFSNTSTIASGLNRERFSVDVTPLGLRATMYDNVGVPVTGTLVPISPGWHHVVLEAIRGVTDTMKVFVDGVVAANDSIATLSADLGTCAFWPYLTDNYGIIEDLDITDDPGTDYPEALTNPFMNYVFFHMPALMGPIAVHFAALTAAQMQNSMLRRDVQQLGSTQILYRWSEVQGVEEWETNPRHIRRGRSDFIRTPGAPKAVQGLVVVPDLSGNNKNTTLQSFADGEDKGIILPAYGQIPYVQLATPIRGQRSNSAFAADPFFQTGGGVPGGA